MLPESFTYPDPEVKVWVPYASVFMPEEWAAPDQHQSHVVARFKNGVPPTAAIKEVSALQYQSSGQWKQAGGRRGGDEAVLDDVVDDVKTPLLVLMAAVSCMLLIACLNVSNLQVARGAARRREVAIRGALGRQPAQADPGANDRELSDRDYRRRPWHTALICRHQMACHVTGRTFLGVTLL